MALTSPLKGKRLRRELAAASRLQFRSLGQQLKAEKRASELQEERLGGWYNDYQARVAALRGGVQNAYSQAGTDYQSRLSGARDQDEALQARLGREGLADAQRRGVDYKPQVAPAQAAQARQNQGLAYGGMVGAQGANQFAYLSDKERIGAGESIAQRLREAARRRSIDVQMKERLKKKADFGVEFMRLARESERKYLLERKAVGLDNRKQSETERHHRETEKASLRTHRRLKKKKKGKKKRR